MLHIFLLTLRRFLALVVQAFAPQPEVERRTGGRATKSLIWRRRLTMLAFLPALALILAVHWIGFLLDEIFYRGYRRTPIREPLFVLGVPRSGTTNLHRVLAQDSQFTTFSTWESLFALSVSARRFWMTLARIDKRLGGFATRALRWMEKQGFAGMDDVHPMTLDAPEEDYFALLPILSCFILILPFPRSPHLWNIGQFDQRIAPQERKRILGFYRRCLQKHLYAHGGDKRLLSKNAAFAPLAGSLREAFPDARFLICLREPARTLPSQLSSIGPGLAAFGTPPDSLWIRDRFVEQLKFYYLNLSRALGTAPAESCAWLSMAQLRHDLGTALRAVYQQLGLPFSDQFRSVLEHEAQASRRYRSGHSYELSQFDLDAQTLEQEFSCVYKDPLLRRILTAAPTQSLTKPEPASRNCQQDGVTC